METFGRRAEHRLNNNDAGNGHNRQQAGTARFQGGVEVVRKVTKGC